MCADEPGKDDERGSGTGNQNEKEHDRSNFYDVTPADRSCPAAYTTMGR